MGYLFATFETIFCLLMIINEGSVPEMRKWYILLNKSNLKWCIHLSRSLFLYYHSACNKTCFSLRLYKSMNMGSIRELTHVKADMKSHIPLETAAIFFLANLFLNQGIQHCSCMKSMSFCCLTHIYCSKSKMTPILYDNIMVYVTKLKHSLAWYDVALNSTINTCIILYKF